MFLLRKREEAGQQANRQANGSTLLATNDDNGYKPD